MRHVLKAIVWVLGAGLPQDLVAGRIGEAENLGKALAESSRRPVSRWTVFAAAADNVLADRWEQVAHLPTLALPGAVLAAAGTALVGFGASQSDSGNLRAYGAQGVSVVLLALALALTHHYPRRSLAVVAVLLSASMLYPLPRWEAVDLASYRHGTVVLPADYLGAPAMFAAAILLPLAFVPLAFRRRRIEWRGLPDAIRSSTLSRRAWPALSVALVVLAPLTFVSGLLDADIPDVVKIGMALNAAGMALCALGIHHTVRGDALSPPAGAGPG